VAAIQTPMQPLELVREAKIFDILKGSSVRRLGASGVLAKDGLTTPPTQWVTGAMVTSVSCSATMAPITYVSWVAPQHSSLAEPEPTIAQAASCRRFWPAHRRCPASFPSGAGRPGASSAGRG